MKKYILPLAIFFAVTSCTERKNEAEPTVMPTAVNNTPQNEVQAADPTTVQVLDSVYNFGSVEDGSMVEYSFRFKNTGNKPLIIKNTTASCGCTVPEKPEQPILPGEIGFIKVKFDSRGRVGEAHKTINVESNASPSFPELLLTGNVTAKNG